MLKRLEITSSESDRKLSASLLKQFTVSRSLEDGRELHGLLARVGRDHDTFLGNLLVGLYSKCGQIDEAYAAFNSIHQKNIFSWNSILAANCNSRYFSAAEFVLQKMPIWDCSSWTILLALYSSIGDLASVSRLLDKMPEVNGVALTVLLNANARAGHIEMAIHTFEHMHERDLAAHNAMLAAYSESKYLGSLWNHFRKMPSWDFVSLNTALAATGDLEFAKRFFDSMPERDVISWNSMLQMYSEVESLDFATFLFDRMPNHSLVSWNSFIQIHSQHCQYDRALKLLEKTPVMDSLTCSIAIQIYSGLGLTDFARQVFDLMDQRDVVTWSTMLVAYTHAGDLYRARNMLENMPQHNVVAETAMLVGYSSQGNLTDAMIIFNKMPELDVVAWNCMLVAYTVAGNFLEFETCFKEMPMYDTCSWNSYLQAHARYGDIRTARFVLDSMPQPDLVSWNSMLVAYVQAGLSHQALVLFAALDQEGIKPDSTTYSAVLNACAETGALTQGRLIHTFLEEDLVLDNAAIWTALINMYGRCGSLDEIKDKLLLNNRKCDLNNVLLAYARNGHHEEVVRLFKAMDVDGLHPDDRSHVAAIDACGNLADLAMGKIIHSSLAEIASPDQGIIISTALLNLYGSCGEIFSARGIFDAMPDKDTASWKSIISQTGSRDPQAAVRLFREMDLEGSNPDGATLAKILDICSAASIDLHIDDNAATATRDPHLSTSLLAMYGRCGRLHAALAVFQNCPYRDTATWNAMLAAYSLSATFDAIIQCFYSMQLHGVPPDTVTFVTLLAACSHAGELGYGGFYVADMADTYGVVPNASHYVCMADLLSRLGQLDRAEGVIHGMPYEPDPAAWTSVLGACSNHGSIQGARDAARRALDVDPRGSSSYVLLSNALGSTAR